MTYPQHPKKKQVPTTFRQYNETQFRRTVRLTRQAIAKLRADNRTVTLAAIAATTQTVDDTGKGLTATTILRNPEAAALFRRHSPACQVRQQTGSANSPAETEAQIPTAYRGLSSTALIERIEKLKKQTTALKAKQRQLKAERDEAYRLRDEVLRQNTRQLAMLTRLMSQSGEMDN